MSNQTKIIVIRQKHLLTGLIITVAVLLLVFIALQKDSGASTPEEEHQQNYTAGVYSSTILLNGNPIEIRVTMDNDLIHDITTANVSDSIETVFPLFDSCFEEIATQVIANNSTNNITYSEGNQYTGTVLLEAIEVAIDKAK